MIHSSHGLEERKKAMRLVVKRRKLLEILYL